MGKVTLAKEVKNNHAELVADASGVIESLPTGGEIMLCDAGEELPARRRDDALITLCKGDEERIERRGAFGFRLTYNRANASGPRAALLAASVKPGDPVCADSSTIAMLTLADRVARSGIPVLVEGPTGTGKEVLARFIHKASPRRDGPFIAVNCAAMPEAMLEAMLFGHRKGAFTGASEAGEGFFRAADGGTLLLDEIGEMPIGLQAKLLRALQEGEVVPLGATKPISVDVRIVACTNRHLPTEIAEGRFREDLYYRLNVFPLRLDALQDRPDDIAPLAFAMVMRHAAGDVLPWISEEALDQLCTYSFPGNIRELENVMRRALLLAGDSTEIGVEHIVFDMSRRLQPAEVVPMRSIRLSSIGKRSEAQVILATLDECDGKRLATARKLGISERTLRYRLAEMREEGLVAA